MFMLFQVLSWIASLAALVCFIMVVVAMFKAGDTTLGIVCIVLAICGFGLGALIAFVMGWVNAGKWNVQKIMPIWTAAAIAWILFGTIALMTAPAGQGLPAIGG